MWRDGQKRRVFEYRFFTTGTIEEKVLSSAPAAPRAPQEALKRSISLGKGVMEVQTRPELRGRPRAQASADRRGARAQVYQRQLSKEGLQGGLFDAELQLMSSSSEDLRDLFSFQVRTGSLGRARLDACPISTG